jgi:hypothetical protein
LRARPRGTACALLPRGTLITLTGVDASKYGNEGELVATLIEAPVAGGWDEKGTRPDPPWPSTV